MRFSYSNLLYEFPRTTLPQSRERIGWKIRNFLKMQGEKRLSITLICLGDKTRRWKGGIWNASLSPIALIFVYTLLQRRVRVNVSRSAEYPDFSRRPLRIIKYISPQTADRLKAHVSRETMLS